MSIKLGLSSGVTQIVVPKRRHNNRLTAELRMVASVKALSCYTVQHPCKFSVVCALLSQFI